MRRAVLYLVLMALLAAIELLVGCGTCRAQDLPVSPVPRHMSKPRLAALVAVSLASTEADIATSQAAFRRGGVETDPLFGARRPGALRMNLVDVPIALTEDLIGYKMAESRNGTVRRMAFLPAALASSTHLIAAIHNVSVR